MRRRHRLMIGIAAAAYAATVGLTIAVRAYQADTPTNAQIAFATEVSDLMLNEIVSALHGVQ
jgi:hypothetical protein